MLRAVAFTVPATVYVALFTANTGLETNAPTAEVSGGAYARVASTFTTGTGGTSENGAEVAFATATADWGSIGFFALVDHLSATDWGTGVNVLMWSPVDTTKTVSNADQAKFAAGAIDITVS